LVFALTAAVLLSLGGYLKRGLMGKYKESGDAFGYGRQFDKAPPPVCIYTYSAWGACQSSGTQTRTLVSSSPPGCVGTPDALSQACTYTPPAPCQCCINSNGQASYVGSGSAPQWSVGCWPVTCGDDSCKPAYTTSSGAACNPSVDDARVWMWAQSCRWCACFEDPKNPSTACNTHKWGARCYNNCGAQSDCHGKSIPGNAGCDAKPDCGGSGVPFN